MSKTRLKLIIWFVFIWVAAAAAWFGFQGMLSLVTYFQEGADPSAALNIVPNVPPDWHSKITWLPDDADTGRPMEPFTREQIGATYLRAWLQWHLSYLKGEPFGLKTYFTKPALSAISDSVVWAAQQELLVEQADLEHNLRLHFYSADGSIVAFTDEYTWQVQRILDADGDLIHQGELRASYEVIMVLLDGNWRIQHWVQTLLPDSVAPPPDNRVLDFVQVQDGQLMLAGAPYPMHGINYYPQENPWAEAWAAYDPDVTRADFERIRQLGLNTIRIFVHYDQFGGPNVDLGMLDHLEDLLDQAVAHDLRVIVTLFDLRAEYAILRWPDADRHIEGIVPRFSAHPAILAWDVKNEPDYDYEAFTQPLVDAWLEHVITLVRQLDPNHLVTIGWAHAASAAASPHPVDLVTFHFYAPAAELPAAYGQVQAAVGVRPVLLGEFGLPTWNSYFFPNGHTAAEQAQYYADILAYLRTVPVSGFLAWTLYDFPTVPTAVVGGMPWRTGPEKHLGVIQTDRTLKPAALLLAPGAALDVPAVPPYTRFLKPFWITVAASFIAMLVLSGLVWWVGFRGPYFRKRPLH